jgi:hypothetical protein
MIKFTIALDRESPHLMVLTGTLILEDLTGEPLLPHFVANRREGPQATKSEAKGSPLA